jgi:hypothetical protein
MGSIDFKPHMTHLEMPSAMDRLYSSVGCRKRGT